MATTTPLGIVKLDGVTVAKMELLEAAARKQFGGTNLSATSGTIQDHGASAIYEYDGTDILTISIIKLPSIFGHKLMDVPELQSKILAWVEETINPPEPVPVPANELSTAIPASVPVLDKTTPKTVPTVTVPVGNKVE